MGAVKTFAARYGRWAVVAGASEGIGAAFATALAARGLDVVLVARRRQPLADLAALLSARYGVATRIVTCDLADTTAIATILTATADLEVGLLVCNAAVADMAPFYSLPAASLSRALDVNCRAPLLLTHAFGMQMIARGRGGIVLMSSLAGILSSPFAATYAASKAFEGVLAESIFGEKTGIDVIACLAGPTDTPTMARQGGRMSMLSPSTVAESTLAALGRSPRVIPGAFNRGTAWLMARVPRKWVIALVAAQTRKLVPQ